MKFPNPFRSKTPTPSANVAQDAAAPSTPRAPRVVDGLVSVHPNGVATFACQLAPDELHPASLKFISWLADEDREKFPELPSEAYTGVLLQREPNRPNIFVANTAFFEFMQFAIASVGPHLLSLKSAARHAQRTGGLNMFIYDARIDPWLLDHPDEMPADDEAIGLFLVREGKITTDAYLRNTRYNRWSSDGPTRIPVQFYDPLMQHMRSGASYHPE